MVTQAQITALIELASRAPMSSAERLWLDSLIAAINAQLAQNEEMRNGGSNTN